jgi:hypothetical protein
MQSHLRLFALKTIRSISMQRMTPKHEFDYKQSKPNADSIDRVERKQS